MFRHFAAAAVLATALAVPMAASAQPMNLVDAVSYALDHNPTVAQQYAAVTTAQHNLALARGNAFPTVNATAQNSLGKSANYGGAYAAIGIPQNDVYSQNTAQIGTNYLLNTGGLAFLQLANSRALEAQARKTLANTENQIATTVTTAYYNVVQRQANVLVDESDLHYQNVLVDAAKAKEHAGVAAGVDVLKAQVNQAKSASTLVGAQNDVINARETLAQTIGAPLDTAFVFPKTIAEPALPKGSVDTLQSIALASRPDLEAAKESLLATQYTRKGWSRELFPQVQIGAAIGNQLSTIQINPITGAPEPHQGTPGFWTLTAQSTFSLPIIDYNARHSERVNDDAQVANARVALEQTQTQVQIDVRQSYRGAQTALAQVDYAREEAVLGTESARISELQYEHGLIALADVIQTQQQSVLAQLDFVNARVAYVNSVVKLRVSLGIYDANGAVADLGVTSPSQRI